MKRKFKVTINNKMYEVEVEEIGTEGTFQEDKMADQETILNKKSEPISAPDSEKAAKVLEKKKEKQKIKEKEGKKVENIKIEEPRSTESVEGKEVKAPLPGIINEIAVVEGQAVKEGDKLLVIEAMKMENEIPSEYNGVVEKILVKKGDTVEGDQPLMIIK
ncbi:biotin/lipoyl-containing protein [Petrotoga sp. 9PWA.NaAc.5.4]|uniref:biotin/lipoyl-containing protein n=1 Tax=Petrotoga sp. 9PWA.NaAc.5.4 TaxID=1434328 RepID=UPI000CC54064|nr:biotin/lipoyl-containing protein [Petrotoga sp. 9PWA.NaAc.5.4]PNR95352.1 propionyl-CoA carboxylase [Petrotoga sp. 9PWA.NaAc.5.4]